jgi:hypothetical protein
MPSLLFLYNNYEVSIFRRASYPLASSADPFQPELAGWPSAKLIVLPSWPLSESAEKSAGMKLQADPDPLGLGVDDRPDPGKMYEWLPKPR